MQTVPAPRGTAWRRPFIWAVAGAFLAVVSLADAAVRGVYVGGEFYPPSADTELAAKQSGFNTMFLFTMQIQSNGDIRYNDTPVVTNGVYVGDTTWKTRLAAVKNDGRITRIEAVIGSYGSGSFDAIKTYVNAQGTGPTSILYKNFQVLINNTGVDAFQFDDEGTYDVASSVAFGKMLAGMGVKVTFVPYTAQSYWVSVRNLLGSAVVDAIYLQCYDGGQYNDPGQWNQAFGNGVKVYPGLWGNTSTVSQTVAQMRSWQQALGMNGGFMWLNGTLTGDGNAEQWGDALRLSIDPTPYFLLVNKFTGGCMDLISADTDESAPINQYAYDYTSAEQRWAILPTENGDHFKLLNWVSGYCACPDQDSLNSGTQIHSYTYTGNNPAQQWDLVDAGNGYFKIKNVNSGKIIDVTGASKANNAVIEQNTDASAIFQLWRLQPQGDYYLRASTGRYVCVEARGNANGNAIVQYDQEPNPWFQWRWQNVGNGYYKLANLNALSRVLGVVGASTVNSAPTQLYDYNVNNTGEQKVRLTPLTDGHYKFHFVHDGMSWEIPNGQTANLTPLEQYPDDTNPWQEFDFERVPDAFGLIVPATPGGLSVTMKDGTATLAWTADAYANGFNVKRATISGGPYTTVAGTVDATGYGDAGLAPAGKYYYVISGVSAGGESGNSAEVVAVDPYQQWVQQNGYTPGAANSGFAADATGSGVPNGVRYAVPGGLKVAPGAGASTVTLDLRNDPALFTVLMVSTDLVTWNLTSATETTASDQTGVAAGFTRIVFQDTANAQAPRLFYRLQITR